MGRELFGIEKGLKIFDTNGDQSVADLLQGTAVPGGDTGDQDAAPIPSLYFRSGTAEIYRKIASANATSDWELVGGVVAPDQTFREEAVRVVSVDTFADGARDLALNPFSDDEGTLITGADFVVGDFVILGQGTGSPILKEVTAVAGNVVTFVTATNVLVEGNNFVAKNYLPDSDGTQEGQALVHYNGTDIVKLGDIDWAFATGINLSAGYVAAAGDVVAGDTVEGAIAKLDGNNDAQDTLLGTAQGAVDLGTGFTGTTIPDNSTVTAALQALETAVELGTDVNVGPVDIAQATPTTVDTVLVDEFQSVEWIVTAHDIGTPGNVKVLKVLGLHNGSATTNATDVKDNVYVKMRIGNFNLQADVVIAGTGAAQTMGLVLNTTDADGIRYTVSRAETTLAL